MLSREELLRKVWGYDYVGETRTVDVHVRRLRAKLGDKGKLIRDCDRRRLQVREQRTLT